MKDCFFIDVELTISGFLTGKRKIEAMEREIYLNMLHNGIEGEDNENPPSENKGK